MQTPIFETTDTRPPARRVAMRLPRLPWRVWLKIIAAIPALAATTTMNVPDPLINWVLSATVLVWVSAYTVWHLK
jgi:hypothetical protein